MELNDSPEIPDMGETSDIPGLPSGGERKVPEALREKARGTERERCGELCEKGECRTERKVH